MFYIIYQYYTEFNQFEGEWTDEYKEFETQTLAEEFKDRILKSLHGDFKFIAGPLIAVKN